MDTNLLPLRPHSSRVMSLSKDH